MSEYLNELMDFMKRIKEHKSSYIFKQNIEEIIEQVPSYTDVIKQPIDLNKIEQRITRGQFLTLEDFKEDMELMFNNCKT